MKPTFQEFGKGTPVLLIHAFPLSGKMWKPQIEILAARGFRVILPELPGFGENKLVSEGATIGKMADGIVELLDHIKIDRAIIGGLSMGGYVALNLFRRYSQMVRALILCDTTHVADNQEKRQSRLELIEKIERLGSIALVENLLPNLISENTKQNNVALVESLKVEISNVDPKAAMAALRAMAERDDSSPVLAQISVPTALIFGVEDKITTLQNGLEMQKKIEGSILYSIEKAGHVSNLEQPDSFNEALLDFCQKVKL